jgi:60 kDa SS-A/Ro ribonucleoprotein
MNRTLFASPDVRVPAHDALNHEGAPAYLHTSEHALIQLAFTGCFNSTFYAKSRDQLENAKRLAADVSPRRLAQIAIAGRKHGFMKDAPAFLLALLSQRDSKLFAAAFPQVVTNPKMLRTYTQMALSGQAGKLVNLASGVHRRMYQQFFDRLSAQDIFNGDVGDKPSLVNVLRMAHVKPNTKEKEAVFQYVFNREFGWKHTKGTTFGAGFEDLPEIVKEFDAYKNGHLYGEYKVPNVDYRLVEGLVKTPEAWAEVFLNASFYVTFKNLATAARQKVFDVPGMQEVIVEKLRDREAILASKVFPYQIFTAYLKNKETGELPHKVNEALQDALDISLEKVPSLGKVYVACDVSESMKHPYTGNQDEDKKLVNVRGGYVPSWMVNQRRTISSKTRCVDVAALIASAILRTNRDAVIVPFNGNCIPTHLNSRDSVVTNAEKLSALCRGGTNCSHPLLQANDRKLEFDTFVLISDNESWVDTRNRWNPENGTRLHAAWQATKKRLPHARMINIDLTPNDATQVKERPDILQVGGFSDSVFDVMSAFRQGGNSLDFWAKELDKIEV